MQRVGGSDCAENLGPNGALSLLSSDWPPIECCGFWLQLSSGSGHLLSFQEESIETSLIVLFSNMLEDLNYSPTINAEEPLSKRLILQEFHIPVWGDWQSTQTGRGI